MIAPEARLRALDTHRAKRALGETTLVSTRADEALRTQAIRADAGTTTHIDLSLLWRELARGITAIVDGFFTDERCYLVLGLKPDGSVTPIEGRRLEILEAVLTGSRQKNIAIDLRLAPSTIALNSRLALESLGVCGKPSRAHPLLMLAARAASESVSASVSFSTFVTADMRELRVIGMTRPDRGLSKMLPSAELAVIRSLVEGLCYEDIAARRGTSTRTIANQISAVFRRLRVSGRNELVQRLCAGEPLGRALPRLTETIAPTRPLQPLHDPARRSA